MKPALKCEFYTGAQAETRARWVADRIEGCARGWTNCTFMEVARGEIIGGVVFHDWNPEAGTMCMSAAGGEGWMTRKVLHEMHSYIFDTAGCQLAVLQTSENNKTMCRIARAFGYRDYCIPRLRGRNEAELIWTLADDVWRASKFYR